MDILKDRLVFFDGAMGTMLQEAGLQAGEAPERLNIEKPELVMDIHKRYLEAGSDIITTNTFGANRLKLNNTSYSVKEAIVAGVAIARNSGKNHYVALDIGPIGQILEPTGTLSFDKAYELFKEQIVIGTKAGVDLILIETMSDLYEMKAAILAAKENSNIPIFATMTFQENGRTLMGTDPKTMVFVLEALGVDVLGINCSLGPKDLSSIVDEVLKYSSTPVMVKPNAGLPYYDKGKTIYNFGPKEFSQELVHMANKGVAIFGGCCGTNPDHIRYMIESLKNKTPIRLSSKEYTTICSGSKTVFIDDSIKIVGERINPTGKKELKNALISMNMDYVLNEAINQHKLGADILDINVGLPEIDEAKTMSTVIKRIQGILDIPLQIDSTKPQVIEEAARIYNGKPIINSVNGDIKLMEQVFPIAKKYGANIIGLTIDEKGLPKTCEERIKICEKIIGTAEKYGIDKNNIIIDCLTLTASVDQAQVFETLKAIKEIKTRFGVKTVLGVSNISYGLPQRELLNKSFLIMALTYGLDLPIINPNDKEMTDIIRAFRVLSNTDKNAENYIKNYKNVSEDSKKHVSLTTYEKDIETIIYNGLKDEIITATEELLKTVEPMDIVNSHIIPALDLVGEKYENGDIFLPQLIQSAETVKKSFEIIKKHLNNNKQHSINKGKILLATVKGDIHDIGKNIVKVLLENYGYEVIDLGKDVSIEDILTSIIKHDIRLVGLSALMTTTVANMEKTILEIKQKGLQCKIMVGGAVLTEEYAQMIGADYYGKDAREAVRIAEAVFDKQMML